jgi:O-antigen/teichoic acid export membrane protein
MTGVMITGTLLTQADKIVLSKLVPLTEFGYYAVASTLATGLLVLITPIFTTFYPRFAAKARSDDCSEAAGLFHLGCQIMAAAALPAAATVAAFPEQILQLWTRDALISGNASSILAFLVIGNALNGLMTLPYAMQVAKGWTSLPIVFNLFALLVLIPGVYNAALLYGIAGGGVAWAALNLGYVLITPHIMHRRLLPGEKRRWYLFSVFVPVLVSATIACVAMLLFRAWQSAAGRPGDLAVLAMMLLCWATISIAIVSCMPDLRSVLLRLYAARVAP